MKKHLTRLTAALLAAAMAAPIAINAAPLTASASELCGESTFTHKAIPWHPVEQAPAKQDFKLDDGTFHITILKAKGMDNQWDLQFRHRKLNFRKGHEYKVSFRAKASRAGLKINSKIWDIGEPYHEYCTLKKEGFVTGPHMGDASGWGEPVELTTEWQTFEGTFTCTEDLKAKEWAFQYAAGEKGNAEDGDEIWFDDMHIECLTCDKGGPGSCGYTDVPYYTTERAHAGVKSNFISVNQLGYPTKWEKIAVLGDNAGSLEEYAKKLELTADTYGYELVEAESGKVVHTGTTGKKTADKDSGDTVCKIDFSEFDTPGTYFLRIKDQDWRSPAFKIGDNIYSDDTHDLLTNAANYFYQNRSGQDIEEQYITSGNKSTLAHRGGHKIDTATVQKLWQNEYLTKEDARKTYASSEITVTGGWYEGGDHGKSVVSGGTALWTLQNMYERGSQSTEGQQKFADKSGTVVVPESGNGVPDILDECAYELDFMKSMVVQEDEPTWGEYAGLVYSKVQDHKWTGLATRPWIYDEEYETVRIVKPPTFAATLNFAACAAQAARLLKDYDAEKAAGYWDAAKKAYAAYLKNYYEPDMKSTTHPWYQSTCPAEELNEQSLYAPMLQAKGSAPYGDFDVKDDAYWAACELYISASEFEDEDAAKYLKDLSDYDKAFTIPERVTGGENEDGDGSYTVFNWGNTAAAGSLDLLMHAAKLSQDQRKKLEASVKQVADSYLAIEKQQGYGLPYRYDGSPYSDPSGTPEIRIYGYEYGSNGMVLNNMIVMAYAYDLTSETKYLNGMQSGMNYLLGCNPLSFSYISGYGEYGLQNPSHRYWSYELDDTLPKAPDGVICGGPNVQAYDTYLRLLGFDPLDPNIPSQRYYTDSIEARAVNEVSLGWNASLAWVADFLQNPGWPHPHPVTTTTAPETTTTTQTTTGMRLPYDWGNINGSQGSTPEERIDVSDAVLLARFLSGDSGAKITDEGKENANVIKGALDENDLTAILMFIVKRIKYEQFPLDSLPS